MGAEIIVTHPQKRSTALRGEPGSGEWIRDFNESVLFPRLRALRDAGQAEYAHGQAFGNFTRLGTQLDLPPMKVLWVYLQKHMDGIASYLKGHVSQREDVAGRIEDAIVYLMLLRAWREIERLPALREDERLDAEAAAARKAAAP